MRRFIRSTGIWIDEPKPTKMQMLPNNYRELQALARELGIRANQSAKVLREEIIKAMQ